MSQQRRSRRQEQALADSIGGRRTPGSGNGWVTKNDVKAPDISVELKYTDKKSYSLKLDELKQAERQALMDSGRGFAFVVGFATGGRVRDEYVIIPRADWEALRGNPE